MAAPEKEATSATCVGIIMDGNRRWARARGLPTFDGHTAGLAKAKEIIRYAFSSGVGTVILYAFSTENWKRPPDEVSYLMRLFGGALMDELAEIAREDIRVRFIGNLSLMPEKSRAAALKLERDSATAPSGKTLAIALSYGGRAEILAAANHLLAAGKREVSEDDFAGALWSADVDDPDLIIRTGGEKRLSNFLPWQSVYSELFFTDSFWPEFSRAEFDGILADFAARERRHGT
ncbi:MAG TPA: polyprenyl diphosphate synthase [Candidatus Paceibacterota bacterium]|nr:polyprenyl diphosphate synthase [Candidatus Paceibacterota bacterium]